MEPYIKVAIVDNQFEAGLLSGILQERGIPHHITTYHDAAYDGLFQNVSGWGAVYAPQPHQAAIREIVSSLREGRLDN